MIGGSGTASRALSELSVGGRIASFLNSRGDLLISCPDCLSKSTSKRKQRTSSGRGHISTQAAGGASTNEQVHRLTTCSSRLTWSPGNAHRPDSRSCAGAGLPRRRGNCDQRAGRHREAVTPRFGLPVDRQGDIRHARGLDCPRALAGH